MIQNKVMQDLHRLLKNQNFKNEEEINEFLNRYKNQMIPQIPQEELDISEQAEDKVFEAYDSSKVEGIKLAKEALKLDKDCILAYQYLGENQDSASKAKDCFLKGIEIGKKKFGGKYEEENKGRFWRLYETRPYMTCILDLANCEYVSGDINECIRLLEYLLELNPSDNQGVRHILASYLLEAKQYDKYEQHAKANKEDESVFFKFNNALFEFIKSGNSLQSINLLQEAIACNQYVIGRLGKKATVKAPTYTIGSKEEAIFYCDYNAKSWKTTKGAISWAKQISG